MTITAEFNMLTLACGEKGGVESRLGGAISHLPIKAKNKAMSLEYNITDYIHIKTHIKFKDRKEEKKNASALVCE